MKPIFSRCSLLLIAATIWTIVGASCHTMRGLGRDVQTVGDKIEDAGNR